NMIPGLLDGLAGRAQAILGPWAHLYPHTALPGPQAGFPSIALRWWDRWLKGLPNGAEADPPLRVYLERSAPPDASARHRPGDWIALGSVPAAQVEWGLSPGRLAPGPCAPLCEVVDSPQQIGMAGGAYFPTGLAQELPGDQAGDDALSVCFDSAPLEAPLALLGRPVLEIALSCDTPRGHLVARLCDVAPEGSSRRIAHGVLNLCHRDSAAAPRDVPPGQVLHLTLPLDMMAHRLMPGHRLRLALSPACSPLVRPGHDRARLTLHAGQLMLPCPADDAPPCTLPPAESPQPGTTRALSPARAGRQVETDPDGTRTLVIATDSGAEEIAAHGLIHRETCTERWQIRPDDPLSARADIDWTHEMSRGGWQVRVETRSTMTADATHLHMTAEAVARDGRAEIARRNWSESVPRDWV
ncbi:MAG TPA: CocE/NonD family hydrolase C-terminal non-catalytic domain-containing protein, partial [Paracoccaceae bacterium]|nr:CocE/NonD family hydrolase C-terminal non-catalytic domain-containing protein [Paracoccaceae bacterium]